VTISSLTRTTPGVAALDRQGVRRACRAVHHDRMNDGLIGRETARCEGTTKTARSVRRLQVVRRATSRRDCDKY